MNNPDLIASNESRQNSDVDPGEVYRILIAESHSDLRSRLQRIFDETPDMVVAGQAADGDEALEMIKQNTYDVVLLDITLPKKNGIEVLRQLRNMQYPPRAIILSTFSERRFAAVSHEAGAAAYLEKSDVPNDLISTIRRIVLPHKHESGPVCSFLRFPEVI